ncbi:bactofilin family protein [Natronomonas marina]|jgi:cytoskeletal protein CcmA (bactofilin family)|uniref:bactofilin family protein n=1 Tax=Natronomonas marina TaxID=2961939 RepID=UPI0020C99548|nr:polymer-forming cytoskeletal protein [Natronomonas marina]
MRDRFLQGSLVLLVTLLVVLAAMPGLAAAETRTGGSVVVAEGETVDGLETFAGSVVVRGTVEGDLSAFAGDVTVAETGRVTGDVASAAGSIRIAGAVDGDVSGAAGDVTVAETATVGGNLDAGAGTLRIDGTVDGDVTVGAERIVLGPTASVGGDLTYDGRLEGPRSAVAGTVERDSSLGGPGVFEPVDPGVSEWVFGVYGFLVNLALGAILLAAFPGFSRRVADSAIETPVQAGALGLGLVVAVPILLVLVALTIVGIPLTLVGSVLFAVLVWVGAVYGRIAVGTWLTSYTTVENRWVALLVGFLVVGVAVRVPWVGWIPELLVFLLGFGALALALNERRRRSRRTAEEGAPATDTDSDTTAA